MEAGERQIKGLRQSAVLHTAAASGIHFIPVMERGHQQIVESDEVGFSRPLVTALAPRRVYLIGSSAISLQVSLALFSSSVQCTDCSSSPLACIIYLLGPVLNPA
ncbi:hypothetical protein Q8A67_021011 [Cirrhinus molitorella]|uniref:Uncharacterized protein n=1 Tax=Cirrhinus molitorella TaxID=172907 RepID=A0AA88PBE2_9TELE|nr:hypothetical protein Q8A67_021011 [Cirrhinus molitorella]